MQKGLGRMQKGPPTNFSLRLVYKPLTALLYTVQYFNAEWFCRTPQWGAVFLAANATHHVASFAKRDHLTLNAYGHYFTTVQ